MYLGLRLARLVLVHSCLLDSRARLLVVHVCLFGYLWLMYPTQLLPRLLLGFALGFYFQ